MTTKLCVDCKYYRESGTRVRRERKPGIINAIKRIKYLGQGRWSEYDHITHACLRKVAFRFNAVVGRHLEPLSHENVRRCEDERADSWNCGPRGRAWRPREWPP